MFCSTPKPTCRECDCLLEFNESMSVIDDVIYKCKTCFDIHIKRTTFGGPPRVAVHLRIQLLEWQFGQHEPIAEKCNVCQ